MVRPWYFIGDHYLSTFKRYKPLAWILDRLIIPTTLGAGFVRIGNFFNSEIVGNYTGNNFGVVFANRGEMLPRHPAQLYEAIAYFILFFFLRYCIDKGLTAKTVFCRGLYVHPLQHSLLGGICQRKPRWL